MPVTLQSRAWILQATFLNMERKIRAQTQILHLQHPKAILTTGPAEMKRIAADVYSELYSASKCVLTPVKFSSISSAVTAHEKAKMINKKNLIKKYYKSGFLCY